MSLPQSLQGINGRLAFAGDGIRFEDLTAQLAGGRVRVGGRVGMDGYTIGKLGVSMTGEKMEFRTPRASAPRWMRNSTWWGRWPPRRCAGR